MEGLKPSNTVKVEVGQYYQRSVYFAPFDICQQGLILTYMLLLVSLFLLSIELLVYSTLRLIRGCKELDLQLPCTAEECLVIADGFKSKSYKEAITNCIGAIDRYLLRIIIPAPKEQAGNVRSFFPGHYRNAVVLIYKHYVTITRAFYFFEIAAPGSINDRESIKEFGLLTRLTVLPKLFVIIGDSAYEPMERLIPMFYGVNKFNTHVLWGN
jgi:hypothetical protein